MSATLFMIAVFSSAAALFRAQTNRVFPLPSGLIFAAYPPMGYATLRK